MTSVCDQDVLTEAVLSHLAESRGDDHPLGGFAVAVLRAEVSLRESAAFSWHAEALSEAVRDGLDALNALPPEQRGHFEREAAEYGERLRNADRTETGGIG